MTEKKEFQVNKNTPFWDASLTDQERIDWLLKEMTVEEKLGYLASSSPDLPRLGIPGVSVGGEAAHGVEGRNDQNGLGKPDVTTSFPQPIGMSASWDPELIRQAGEITGTEARVVWHRHQGHGLSRWAPTVDLERDPRWGRNEEGYGEDPVLTGKMAGAYIRGMQGDDPKYLRCAATLKHFYGNNTEVGRGWKNSSIDPRNKYELYLEPFRRCIEDGGAEGIMTAYNKINGTIGILNPEVTDILKKQYNSMKGWIDFMRAHAVDYIWNYKLQFGDWVALDAEEGSYFGATPNDLTCTAYYAYSTGLFVKMAHALGKEDVAAEYEELYHKIVKKFQETFFDAEGNMTAQTQTAHIVALYFQLTPEKYITKTVEGLKRLLDKENGHLVTGFVGTPYFCHALSQNHALKEAYDLLLKEDFPSWLYQVKKGATTIWEHWDGMKDDGSMWSADMNSFNHYAYGAIGEWMYRAMAGIEADPEHPSFKHAILYPRIGGNLKYTAGKYHSIYGDVGVKWEVQGKQITLTVQIPVNTTAEIRLDKAKAVLESDGLTFTREADYMAAEAGSGTYHIAFEQ